jgi:hypothetical protein
MNLTRRQVQGNGLAGRLPLRAENHKDSTCTVPQPHHGQNGSVLWDPAATVLHLYWRTPSEVLAP